MSPRVGRPRDQSGRGRQGSRHDAAARRRAWQESRTTFAELGESAETTFARVWDADGVTHVELLALAAGARRPEERLAGIERAAP